MSRSEVDSEEARRRATVVVDRNGEELHDYCACLGLQSGNIPRWALIEEIKQAILAGEI